MGSLRFCLWNTAIGIVFIGTRLPQFPRQNGAKFVDHFQFSMLLVLAIQFHQQMGV